MVLHYWLQECPATLLLLPFRVRHQLGGTAALVLRPDCAGPMHANRTMAVIPHLEMCACDWSKLRHMTFTKSGYFPHEAILPPL